MVYGQRENNEYAEGRGDPHDQERPDVEHALDKHAFLIPPGGRRAAPLRRTQFLRPDGPKQHSGAGENS